MLWKFIEGRFGVSLNIAITTNFHCRKIPFSDNVGQLVFWKLGIFTNRVSTITTIHKSILKILHSLHWKVIKFVFEFWLISNIWTCYFKILNLSIREYLRLRNLSRKSASKWGAHTSLRVFIDKNTQKKARPLCSDLKRFKTEHKF